MTQPHAAPEEAALIERRRRWTRFKHRVDRGDHRDAFDDVVAQIEREPDRLVADVARGYLVTAGELSDWELSRLSVRSGFDCPPIDRLIAEERAWRSAVAAKSDAEFLQAARSGFVKTQLRLLGRPVVPRVALAYLAQHGRTRTIRTVAVQRQMRHS